MYAYALRRTDPASSQDIVSETFLTAWRRRAELPSDELPWLLGVARLVLANHARSQRRRDALTQVFTDQAHRVHAEAADVDHDVLHAIAALSIDDREALILVGWGQEVTDPRLSSDGGTRPPTVAVRFTPEGQQRWRALTRRVAERGLAQLRPGDATPAASQHVAIALDHRLLTVPYIDFRQHPDGLDASNGMQIGGGFTSASARTLVALLKSGALPVRLSPETSHH